jgi:hypothetical protein
MSVIITTMRKRLNLRRVSPFAVVTPTLSRADGLGLWM